MSVCGAVLTIGDDYGDGGGTITCQLEEGHSGLHQELFAREDCGAVTITWEKDERVKCSWCGKLAQGDYRCESTHCDKWICSDCMDAAIPRCANEGEYVCCPEHFKEATERQGSNK